MLLLCSIYGLRASERQREAQGEGVPDVTPRAAIVERESAVLAGFNIGRQIWFASAWGASSNIPTGGDVEPPFSNLNANHSF
jgi:hypothetical protein